MRNPDTEITPRFRKLMNAMATALDQMFNGGKKPREVGFVLLVFPYGDVDGRRCNYISNGADRKDMASMFRELAARFEGQPEQPETRA